MDEIIQEVLYYTGLKVNDQIIKIREIELYYYSETHKDSYVHRIDDQLNHKSFYFHKFKNGSYKNGTYRGMDLTFGNRDANIYFGVLIRSIELPDGTFIEGPCRSVNAMVSIAKLNDSGSSSEILRLSQCISTCTIYEDQDDIYCAPRIGLSDKYPEFRELKYRYATNIRKIKKERAKFALADL